MERVIVTGLAGAGKSTFSRRLSEATGLPVVTLDVHYWQPGWVAPPDSAWADLQRRLLAGVRWIADGNYEETLALRLERADTVVVLDMPWWLCTWRALVRGVRPRAPGFVLPTGCEEPFGLRLRAEWRLAVVIFRRRHTDRDAEAAIIAEHGGHTTVVTLRSRAEVRTYLAGV